MVAYAVYSHCILTPGLAQLDDALLRQKQQEILYQHHDLLDIVLTLNHSSQKQLKVVVSGPTNSVLAARGDILTSDAIQVRTTIQSIHPCIISQQKKRLRLNEHLENLANDYGVTFTVNIELEPSITLQGAMARVEAARIQVLVYLDQMLDLHIDSVSLPPLLHNILGGKRHYQLQSVMEETATNIYLETPFAVGHVGIPFQQQQGLVYISGDTAGTKRATLLAKKLAEQKLNCLYHKESSFDPHKADWILLHQQDKLKKLLRDNGTFIHFSQIGSGSAVIKVYGENRINTERTLRLLNHMAHNIYNVTFKIKPIVNGQSGHPNHDWCLEISNYVSRLAEFSGGEVLYRGDQERLDVYGSDTTIRLVYQFIKESNWRESHISTCITIELAAEHRAFMKGKKSGKVNKIVKSCGANIKFIPAYNDYNCLMTVDSIDIDKAFYGLELLSQELPEERSFYVPEIYHRRIIGVGGKNIQRIMKKYGVYVKFSGADEFTELGGYFENEHNVFARTPRKYSSSLQQLYDEVMELVTFEKDRNWVSCNVKVPLYLHRTIPNRYSNALRDYGRLHNTRFWWPPRCGMADVAVVGPVTQVRLIQAALSNLLPRHCYVPVPYSPALTTYLESNTQLKNLKQVMKMDWSVDLVNPDTTTGEIPSTTYIQWQTLPSFKNALIFQLTHTTGSSDLMTGNEDELTAITDHEHRLQMAKKLLIDQLLAYSIPQNTTTATTTNGINSRSMTKQKLFGPTSVLTQADKLDYNWEGTKSYSFLNDNEYPPKLSPAPTNKFNTLDTNYFTSNQYPAPQSPFYQTPSTPTSTIDVIVPQITKTIWSADQSKDDLWCPLLTDASTRQQTTRSDTVHSDSPRFHQYYKQRQTNQYHLYNPIIDRPSTSPLPPQPLYHRFPTPSFSATMNSYKDHFDLSLTRNFTVSNNNNSDNGNERIGAVSLSKSHHLATVRNDNISPSIPHLLSPVELASNGSSMYSPGKLDISLPANKPHGPYHSYMNKAVLTPSFSSPYPR
ncbi:hypothetical protein BC941DRAFT_433867 [Chlamydoabsidia padenii]|nr:hypothetical protein BC941DRAFT_433867 [Chlamydoabsidia padenii]